MKVNKQHPFDPSLHPTFSAAAWRSAEVYTHNGRELFHALLYIGENHDAYPAAYEYVKQGLIAVIDEKSSVFSKTLDWDSLLAESGSKPISAVTKALTSAQAGNYWRQLSPIVLTEPCWLQGIPQAVASENPLAVQVLALYLRWIDREKYRNAFIGLLQTAGIDPPDLPSRVFAHRPDIHDSVFDFATLQLALACFPRLFFPEILGFTLAYASSDWLPMPNIADDRHFWWDNFINLRQHALSSAEPAVRSLITDYLENFPEQADTLWQRIQSGYELYRKQAERCRTNFVRQFEKQPSAVRQWVDLLARKASAAAGHHRKIVLAGRTLDDWFGETPFDARGFLAALRQSPYIDPQNPADSALLKLFDFGGPMFGVLTAEERTVLEQWLNGGLPDPDEKTDDSVPAGTLEHRLPVDKPTSSPIDFSALNSRKLYYYLVNADLYPEVLPAAQQRVRAVLRSAGRFRRLPFKPYSHRNFDRYLDYLYRNEVEHFQPLESNPRLNRETYCWGIEQFAPAILVDGCWLQHVSLLKFGPHRQVGALLFKIYEDECGNGKHEQNHPHIYRKLTASIGLDLPPIGSLEFIQYPGFLTSAFDLPVYLLAISNFPSRFLPELLGLNMAIELSGLGNAYLRLSEELRYWGIDPAIVDIHTAIDNVSSGHAFLAKQAIQTYLDDIAFGFGKDAVENHWRRIHDGYCSLQSACRGFKLALICRYAINRF